MALLEETYWSGRIYSGGWVEGGGQSYPAVEPATGRTLGQVGAAAAADFHRAVGRASAAQAAWAATPYDVRAAVLRRAVDLLEELAGHVLIEQHDEWDGADPPLPQRALHAPEHRNRGGRGPRTRCGIITEAELARC